MPVTLQDLNVGEAIRREQWLYTREVAAIIHDTCRWIETADTRGEFVAAPCADELWVSGNGTLRISMVRTVSTAADQLHGLAALLEEVLPPFSDEPDYAVRSSMRVLPARLRAKPGLSHIADVHELLQTISVYEEGEPAQVLRQLVHRFNGTDRTDYAPEADEDWYGVFPSERDETSTLAYPLDTAPCSTATSELMLLPTPATADVPVSLPKEGRTYVPSVALTWALGIVVGFAVGRYASLQRFPTVPPNAVNLPASVTAPSREAQDAPRQAGRGAVAPLSPPARAASGLLRGTAGASAPTIEGVRGGVGPERTASYPAPAVAKRTATVATPTGAPAPLDLPAPDGAFSPSFAATGSALFFHAGREHDGRLLAAALDSQGPLQIVTMLADGAKNYHPRLSPDERLIAFDSDRDGERAVYIADRNGRDVRRVSDVGFAAIPTWSPNMKWLTFVRAEPRQPKVWNLWRRDLATGELRRLTSYRYGQTWGASWFPDARRICYSHENEIVVLDIETGTQERFQSPRGNRLLRTPAVSPDGSRIVFQVYHDGVWLLDLHTRDMRRIIDDPTAEEFAWNPQGTRVAYHSRRGGEWRIWVTNAPS
jgi:hypothetical protein